MDNKLYDKLKEIFKEYKWYIIAFIIILVVFNIKLPYSIELPGGFLSLNDRIKIDNESETSGEFGMAYVSVIKGTIPTIIYSYINSNSDAIPNSDLTYGNESIDDMNKREKLYLNEAMENAEYVAYTNAHKTVSINNTKLYVAYVDHADSPVKAFDIVTKYNGVAVNSLADILNLEDKNSSMAKLEVIRDNKTITLDVPMYDYNNEKLMGIVIIPNYDMDLDPSITIDTKENESGPSGGLMMSLSIYDKLTGSNLTKGDKIIGTGTIAQDGTVGEIGGVKYKLIGAVESGAKVFICPMENYDEAVKIANEKKYDITIKGVASFNEAVEFLRSR
jgi:Lon-like protease